MLHIEIGERELWDEKKEEFIYIKAQTIALEHSLVAISKWEAEFGKPFLSNQPKSGREMAYYIKCMTITQNVDPIVYSCLSAENIKKINEYIDRPMTAAVFKSDRPSGGAAGAQRRKSIITAETIYHWMIQNGIPFECQKWNFNRLMALIKYCSIKNNPRKKSRTESLKDYAALNAERRKKHMG